MVFWENGLQNFPLWFSCSTRHMKTCLKDHFGQIQFSVPTLATFRFRQFWSILHIPVIISYNLSLLSLLTGAIFLHMILCKWTIGIWKIYFNSKNPLPVTGNGQKCVKFDQICPKISTFGQNEAWWSIIRVVNPFDRLYYWIVYPLWTFYRFQCIQTPQQTCGPPFRAQKGRKMVFSAKMKAQGP